jgi:hypothetical protein
MLSFWKMARKRRNDYGTVQTTERDMSTLKWIGEMYAVRMDHLQILAARLSEDADIQAKGELSFSGIQYLYNRWLKAGWIKKEKIFAADPQWVWLTKKGLRHIGLDYRFWEPKTTTRLRHYHHVNAVRLHLEGKHGQGITWISERTITRERKTKGKKHLVDGEILFQGVRAGIGVELARKNTARLESILKELQCDYEAVYYFAGEDCYNTVELGIKSLPAWKETFDLYPLAGIMGGE